jgi:hypothetical protein
MKIIFIANRHKTEEAQNLMNDLIAKGAKTLTRVSRKDDEQEYDKAEKHKFLMCVQEDVSGNKYAIVKPTGGGTYVILGNSSEYMEACRIYKNQVYFVNLASKDRENMMKVMEELGIDIDESNKDDKFGG